MAVFAEPRRPAEQRSKLRRTEDILITCGIHACRRAGNAQAADQVAALRAGEGLAKINERLASKADLIATCNPSCLPDFLRGKHILSSAQETLWLTQIGDRLKFSTGLDRLASPSGMLQPVALGEKSVSSLLLDPNTRSMLRHKDTHDLGLYADVLRDFKIPAKRVIDYNGWS